jgi:hypothetical protein
MSEEESKPQNQSTMPEWITSEGGVHQVYADYFYANWMPLTVRLRFAQVVPDPRTSPDKSTWVLDERLALTLPWSTTKSLAEFLTGLVTAYENKNGPIVVPEIPAL